jgi:hypothetical protein
MKKTIKNEKEILKLISDSPTSLVKIAKLAGVSLRSLFYRFDTDKKFTIAYAKRKAKRDM